MGELVFRIFGGAVKLSSPNPDPISDLKMQVSGTLFLTCPLNFIPIFRPGF